MRQVKLNLGCGRDVREGWTNIDIQPHPGVVQADVMHMPIDGGTVELIYASHLIEHLPDPLGFMAECYRVAEPDAGMVIRVPHGMSDDAWEDPTHVRPYFPGSFGYFGQPAYWRADYGYRADWLLVELRLVINKGFKDVTDTMLRQGRNVVGEMVATLRAIKPARPAERVDGPRPEIVVMYSE
jgi:SAM-dependent methyltransferase